MKWLRLSVLLDHQALREYLMAQKSADETEVIQELQTYSNTVLPERKHLRRLFYLCDVHFNRHSMMDGMKEKMRENRTKVVVVVLVLSALVVLFRHLT